MRRLLAVLLMLLAVGCSIMDPSDRQELRDRIQSMPENQLSALTIDAMWKTARKLLVWSGAAVEPALAGRLFW